MSPQLVAMIMVSLLALALPLTILSIGLVRMSREPGSVVQQPAPEVPGLRAILERVADERLSPKGLSDGRAQFVIVDKAANWPQHRKAIEASAKSLGGSVLADSTTNIAIFLVQIPVEAANRFQASGLANAQMVSEPAPAASNLVYQIRFEEKR